MGCLATAAPATPCPVPAPRVAGSLVRSNRSFHLGLPPPPPTGSVQSRAALACSRAYVMSVRMFSQKMQRLRFALPLSGAGFAVAGANFEANRLGRMIHDGPTHAFLPGFVESANERTSGIRAPHAGLGHSTRPRPEPGDDGSFVRRRVPSAAHLRVKMPNSLEGSVAHPLAVVANIIREAARASPHALPAHLLPSQPDLPAADRRTWAGSR